MDREVNDAWATWLARRMRTVGLDTPTALSRATGGAVDQSVISRWLNEGRTPSIDTLRKLVGPLKTSLIDLMVRAGHITAEEGGQQAATETIPLGVLDAIDHDLDLIDEARQHLKNQYKLLLRVAGSMSDESDKTEPERLRAVARGGSRERRREIGELARRAREEYEKDEHGGE